VKPGPPQPPPVKFREVASGGVAADSADAQLVAATLSRYAEHANAASPGDEEDGIDLAVPRGEDATLLLPGDAALLEVGGGRTGVDTRATLPTRPLSSSAWRASANPPIIPAGLGSRNGASAAFVPQPDQVQDYCFSKYWSIAALPEAWYAVTAEDSRLLFPWDPLTTCRCLGMCPYSSIDSLAVGDACGGLTAPASPEMVLEQALHDAAARGIDLLGGGGGGGDKPKSAVPSGDEAVDASKPVVVEG